MLIAVDLSPLRRDCWIGEAPRYWGNLDMWTLMGAILGIARTVSLKIMPKAITTKKSTSRSLVIASSSFLFSGWKVGNVVAALMCEGVRICLRPTGRSGWVKTATISMVGSLWRDCNVGTAISGVPKKAIFMRVV